MGEIIESGSFAMNSPDHGVETAHTIFVIDGDSSRAESTIDNLRPASKSIKFFDSPLAFLDQVTQEQIGCIISDVLLPQMSGLQLQAELKRRGIFLPLIFLTQQAELTTATQALRDGAFDYLTYPTTATQLLETVYRAVQKSERTNAHYRAVHRHTQDFATLSDREKEVIALIFEGRTNKEIAQELGISDRTVEVHRAKIMKKMDADSLSQLVRMINCIFHSDEVRIPDTPLYRKLMQQLDC